MKISDLRGALRQVNRDFDKLLSNFFNPPASNPSTFKPVGTKVSASAVKPNGMYDYQPTKDGEWHIKTEKGMVRDTDPNLVYPSREAA